jgi:hypothetical protein
LGSCRRNEPQLHVCVCLVIKMSHFTYLSTQLVTLSLFWYCIRPFSHS